MAALPPDRFLEGVTGCGEALPDVELRLDSGGALLVRTARLCPGWFQAGTLQPLKRHQGWWPSGDGAITSRGETVFPEQVEARLLGWAREMGLPLRHLLLLASADPLWGERLAAGGDGS